MGEDRITFGMRVLAFFCRVCPFCIFGRIWPKSAPAKAMKKVEANCPACRAHWKLERLKKRQDEKSEQ